VLARAADRGREGGITANGDQRKKSTSPPAPLRDGEGSRKMCSEETTDLGKDVVGMVQDQVVGQVKDD
jgi:hypothetical protein